MFAPGRHGRRPAVFLKRQMNNSRWSYGSGRGLYLASYSLGRRRGGRGTAARRGGSGSTQDCTGTRTRRRSRRTRRTTPCRSSPRRTRRPPRHRRAAEQRRRETPARAPRRRVPLYSCLRSPESQACSRAFLGLLACREREARGSTTMQLVFLEAGVARMMKRLTCKPL